MPAFLPRSMFESRLCRNYLDPSLASDFLFFFFCWLRCGAGSFADTSRQSAAGGRAGRGGDPAPAAAHSQRSQVCAGTDVWRCWKPAGSKRLFNYLRGRLPGLWGKGLLLLHPCESGLTGRAHCLPKCSRVWENKQLNTSGEGTTQQIERQRLVFMGEWWSLRILSTTCLV